MPMLRWVVFALTVLLVFIWPIPRTVSLRDLLLLLLCGVLGYAIVKGDVKLKLNSDLRLPVYLLVTLTLWLIFVAVFLSSESEWSLQEISSQWLRGLLALVVGVGIGLWARCETSRQSLLLTGIVAALVVHVAHLDGSALWALVTDGRIPRRVGGLAESLDKVGLIAWYVGAFLLVEVVTRSVTKRRFLRIGSIMLASLMVATIFGSYVADSRNGMIVLGTLAILALVAHVIVTHPNTRRRVYMLFAAVIIVAPLLTVVLAKVDTRWQTFMQTIPIAWDTKTHRAWLEDKYPLPVLPNGEEVSDSNYKRIAYLKEGALLVMERPLGRGFGRQIFGHALKEKYGVDKTQSHSHSGLMNLAIGAGLPGVVLWVIFCIFLIRYGYRSFIQTNSYTPLALLFLTVGFLLAMTLDSMMQDHMFQEFMFLSGLLVILSAPERRHSPTVIADCRN
jgi:hypothetical protein